MPLVKSIASSDIFIRSGYPGRTVAAAAAWLPHSAAREAATSAADANTAIFQLEWGSGAALTYAGGRAGRAAGEGLRAALSAPAVAPPGPVTALSSLVTAERAPTDRQAIRQAPC